VSDALTVLREAGSFRGAESSTRGAAWSSEVRVDHRRLPAGGVASAHASTLAGVLCATLAAYLCPIVATVGQSSGSLLATEIAPLLRADPERPVAYLGDFDPQGDHIEASTRRRLEEHVVDQLVWERLDVDGRAGR
jgi:hypothetical protein